MDMVYLNIKTNKKYIILHPRVINKTKEQSGQNMIAYMDAETKQIYVRELTEFYTKFKKEN